MSVRIGTTAEVLDDTEVRRHTTPEEDSGIGALGTERGNLPLESIDVRSVVTGLAVRTELAQGFRNTFDVPLEATYVFPLPDRAAVTALRMEADDRVVEGILKEREEARADYDRALSEGRRASIAEEERPGVFTLRVGNILPGELVVIRTTLSGRLPYEDGEATYRFPLVVAPRYVPGSPLPGGQVGDGVARDTDAVPDASRISPPVLLPGFPNPVRLAIRVDVDPAGLGLRAVRSSLHGVSVAAPDDAEDADGAHGGRVVVTLNPGDRPNRDFLLRLRFGSADAVTTSLAVRADHGSGDGAGAAVPEGTFVLTVLPPDVVEGQNPDGRDVVLVLDRSGSMDGWKMVAARRAAARIVDTLTSRDRFAALAFDTVVETPPLVPSGLVEATDRHRFRAIEHLARMESRGGTELAEPLRMAADLLVRREGDRRDKVLVLLTDGQVGNESQILRDLAPKLEHVRVHTVGIDRAVNEAFLRQLAEQRGGRYELVESEDRLDEAMDAIHRRIGAPVVTGLRLSAAGLAFDAATVAPTRLPDLFAGAPLVVTGRFTGKAEGALTVSGDLVGGGAAGAGTWSESVPVSQSSDPGLAAVWARGRIRDLEDRYTIDRFRHDELEREIVATSVRFSVLSRFTAFVAVDSRVVNQGGEPHRMTQPVDAPDGWDMFAADEMRLDVTSTKTVRSAPMLTAPSAQASAVDELLEHHRALPAPSMAPMPAPQQAPAAPRPGPAPAGGFGRGAAESLGRSRRSMLKKEELVVPSPDPVLPPLPEVRALAAGLLATLRNAENASADVRVTLLTTLAQTDLPVLLQRLGAEGRPVEDVQQLVDLIAELAGPEPDGAELDRRWQHAVTVLEAFTDERAEPRRSRPFWKR